jgi:nucleoside-diphosphate-sugar epimerase
MNVLLIGGTGNISAEVAESLNAAGHNVIVVSRGRRPVDSKYTHIATDRNDADRFAFAVGAAEVDPDVVINFLGFQPEQCQIDRTVFAGKIRQYIFISTAMVYAKPHDLPVTEDHPRGNDLSDYATAKIACEDWLWQNSDADFPVTIVRPSHTFGRSWIPSPASGSADWTVAARILDGRPIVVHGDGQSLWTLTACADFADGLTGLVGKQEAIGEAFHITHDTALTWNGIYYEIGLALGVQPEIVYIPAGFLAEQTPSLRGSLLGDKANDALFDNTKIKRFVPTFEATRSFRTAIRESVAWYRQDSKRQQVDSDKDAQMDAWIDAWNKAR